MATIVKTVSLDASAEHAWSALADFWALHDRLVRGFVVATEREGDDVRVVTFANGAVARERLVGVDEGKRRVAYSVIESGIGFTHHNASARVLVDGDGVTHFEWIADVLPHAVAPVVEGLMDHGIAAIKETLEASARDQRTSNSISSPASE